jgi:hypothetical protein
MAWRTLRESETSPNHMSIGSGTGKYSPVSIHRPRAALRLDATRIVEDLVVPLRGHGVDEAGSLNAGFLQDKQIIFHI